MVTYSTMSSSECVSACRTVHTIQYEFLPVFLRVVVVHNTYPPAVPARGQSTNVLSTIVPERSSQIQYYYYYYLLAESEHHRIFQIVTYVLLLFCVFICNIPPPNN